MSDLDDKILKEFLADGFEAINHLDQDLVELEGDPSAVDALNRAFRSLHTIKGTCSFFGFRRLERLAHAGESLLGRVRAGNRSLDAEAIGAVLGLVDCIRIILTGIESTGQEPGGDDASALADVDRLLGKAAAAEETPAASEGNVAATPGSAAAPTAAADPDGEAADEEAADPTAALESALERIAARSDEQSAPKLFDSFVKSGRISPEAIAQAETQQSLGDPRRIGEIMVENGTLTPREVFSALLQQEEARGTVERQNVRVDVTLLDRIMNLVGELVLARNQVTQFVSQRDWGSLAPSAQRLNYVTTRLQEEIMRTRMQAISALWVRIPRLVRDVAGACGKQVQLHLEGTGTELDKTLIEAIKDPLIHLVRNAVDHGIEVPEIRRTLGKPPEGQLRLRAFHEGGQVNLEISDDGSGLPLERIRQKVVERRLATPEHAAAMSDRELVRYIFMPGFSTAQRVTAISGRGVGMDVVKSSIDRIGGTIDVQTRAAAGTTFRIRIPLTLAILPGLMVGCSGMRYAVPQVNLVELVPLKGESSRLERVQGAPVFRLRGELLPVLVLGEQLRLSEPGAEYDSGVLVVLRAEGRQFGLLVDRVHDTEEIVVKPLADSLRAEGVYAGATVRGDGQVALILDVAGLARRAGMMPVNETLAAPQDESGSGGGSHPVVVAGIGDRWKVALPLEQIERIEEVTADEIGGPARAPAMRWRDHVIPVVRLSERLGGEHDAWRDRERHLVLVHLGAHGTTGYVVDSIEDIVESSGAAEAAEGDGDLGHTVVEGRIVSLVDLDRLESHAAIHAAGTPHAEAA